MNVNDERRFLAKLALSCYKKGNLNDIIDIDLKKQMNSDSLNMFSEIAYRCLQDDPKQRPSMGWVVEKLEKALQLQEPVERSIVETSAKNDPTNLQSMMCCCMCMLFLICFLMGEMTKKQVITTILLSLFLLILLLLILLFLFLVIRTLCTFVPLALLFLLQQLNPTFGLEQ
ncbi:hypothetical protein Lser_V15G06500 [Lactuca serriola]